jgi:hypothetical protein
MANTVNNAYVQQFKANLLAVMQQTAALVRPKLMANCVRTGVNAILDEWDRVGNVLLQPVGVHTQTVQLLPNHTRRAAVMQTRGGAIPISRHVDLVRMLLNPASDYTRLLGAAAVQTIDKLIIDSALGSATTITTDRNTGQQTYGAQAMLSTYAIGGASAVDLTRVIAAGVLLSEASVPTGAKNRLWMYAPGQETDFMAITQASSSDFTKNRIHDDGTLSGNSWQGFDFLLIPDVVNEAVTTLVNMLPLASTTRTNIAMYKGGVGLSMGEEPNVEINTRADLNNEQQIFMAESSGAVRLWEGAVVKVATLEN